MGVGISGGEEGARRGPAIMPGGDAGAYELIGQILTDISAKADSILKGVMHMSPSDLHEVFKEWNQGELNSYLIGITSDIFAKKDTDSDHYLVDMILDAAGQKGTGKWTGLC